MSKKEKCIIIEDDITKKEREIQWKLREVKRRKELKI